MAYDRDEIFKAIGKDIAKYNEVAEQKADYETIVSEHIPLLNESDETRDYLVNVMDTRDAADDSYTEMLADIVANVRNYLTSGVAEMLDVVTLGVDNPLQKVLDALEDEMYLAGDSVKCQVLPPVEEPPDGGRDVRADIDNAGVGSLLPTRNYDQQEHSDLQVEFEVYDISGGAGSELWRVRSNKSTNHGSLQTGVDFLDMQEVYAFAFKIDYDDQINETGDDLNQLDNWVINGAVKSKGNEFSEKSLANGNSDYYGIYYVKLYDTAGTRYVELYKDQARTVKVAEGNRVGDGQITLAAVGGSGLTGTVDVTYSADRLTQIQLKYPFEFAIGDKYYFNDSTGDATALFQFFFVNQFDRALPCSGTPTVDEDWAKWNLP